MKTKKDISPYQRNFFHYGKAQSARESIRSKWYILSRRKRYRSRNVPASCRERVYSTTLECFRVRQRYSARDLAELLAIARAILSAFTCTVMWSICRTLNATVEWYSNENWEKKIDEQEGCARKKWASKKYVWKENIPWWKLWELRLTLNAHKNILFVRCFIRFYIIIIMITFSSYSLKYFRLCNVIKFVLDKSTSVACREDGRIDRLTTARGWEKSRDPVGWIPSCKKTRRTHPPSIQGADVLARKNCFHCILPDRSSITANRDDVPRRESRESDKYPLKEERMGIGATKIPRRVFGRDERGELE